MPSHLLRWPIDASDLIVERGNHTPQTMLSRIPENAFTRIWFEFDPHGKPDSLRVVTSTGNRGLDIAALRSVEQTRFRSGQRKCSEGYYLDFKPTDRFIADR